MLGDPQVVSPHAFQELEAHYVLPALGLWLHAHRHLGDREYVPGVPVLIVLVMNELVLLASSAH